MSAEGSYSALYLLYTTVMNTYYVYILTNWNNKVMYIGVTNHLQRRLQQHSLGVNSGFTRKYNVHKLVYYETTSDIKAAINREKELKGWRRDRKNRLVASANPQWLDLSAEWE